MSTQHTDRELLELAANAVGLRGCASDINPSGAIAFRVIPGDGSFYYWNPLDDDGDALRLAVKLGLVVDCSRPSAGEPFKLHHLAQESGSHSDAATRRAIVRAAAAIGEAMP